jgi:hypothetical protein
MTDYAGVCRGPVELHPRRHRPGDQPSLGPHRHNRGRRSL